MPKARLAIITDLGGLQRLQTLVRPGKVWEMAYRGHHFGAAEAKTMSALFNKTKKPEYRGKNNRQSAI
ncbi:MAG: hypothetical protein HQK58_09605 [Deltaproteobacteria bacterium]|nr:hypothetical protein [Deltaproteobacteria bacterium]